MESGSGADTSGIEADDPLDDDEVKTAATELSAALSRTQQHRDEFVRVIAAGAVAIAASLIAAIGEAGWSGGLAVGLAYLSLATVLASFGSAEVDIRRREKRAWAHDRAGIRGGRWARATDYLNGSAAILLVAAGAALVIFVVTTNRGGSDGQEEGHHKADHQHQGS